MSDDERLAKLMQALQADGLIFVSRQAVPNQKLVETPGTEVEVKKQPGPELPKKY